MKKLTWLAGAMFLTASAWGGVAKIGDTEYDTFAAAVGVVQDGETITMLADTNESWPVLNKACTIDLGGHKLAGFLGQFNTAGGVCTVRNGTMNGFDGAGGYADKYPYGKMVFENITMSGDLWADSHPITIRNCTLACIQAGDKPIVIESGNIKKLNTDSHTTKGTFIFKGGRFGGDYSSASTYGELGVGCRWVATGDKDYPWEVKNDVATGRLLHRWSFNGSLADSVGGLAATQMGATWDNDSNPKNIRLNGAAKGASYVNIPVAALPKDRAFTIEIFATQLATKNWGRIFSFGVGGAVSEPLQNFFMSWTQGTDIAKDQIRLRYNGDSANFTENNSLQPYTVGVEWHIALVYEPTADGKGRFYWLKEDLGGRQRRESGVTTEFAVDFEAWGISNFWLGRSFWASDSSAQADYDELRIWGVALTPEQLSENAKLGPDALPSGATAVSESRAIWTGTVDSDLTNAGNWSCVDALGAAQSGVVPTAKDYTLCLNGDTAFNCPAGTTPRWGNVLFSPLAGAPKAKFGYFRRPTGETKSWQGGSWKVVGQYDNEFVFFPQGYLTYVGDVAVPNDFGNTTWKNNYLNNATFRVDGWIFVSAAQAGSWVASVGADDYLGFAVDGKWLAITKTYTAWATGTACTVAPGWHRYTLIGGDTYGGESVGGIKIAINGADQIDFNNTNFTLGSADNTVRLTADCDWRGLGTLNLPAGLTLDLNGHNLTIAGAKGTFKGGVTISGTGTLTVNGGTFDDNGITVPNATVVFTNSVVATATWTGADDRTNVNDPANWTCKDADGHTVTGGIPGANTVVELGETTTFQIPAGQTLATSYIQPGASPLALAADCDWRGALTATALPADFDGTRIPYLDAPKGSYINTGIAGHGDLRVVMDATVQSAAEYWFGAWDTSSHKDWNVSLCNDSGELYLAYGNQNYGAGAVVANGRHTLELDRNYYLLDGALKVDRLHNAISYTDTLYLFAQNRGGTAGFRDNQGTIRFHGCKIYYYGKLVRDFVPVQKTDGTVGAYDLVNKVFYANSGSPAFIAGPVGIVKSQTTLIPAVPVDLAGHTLDLAPDAGVSASTVTDTSTGEPGTLHLQVTASQNFANTEFTLSGNQKVVLDAAGAEFELGTKLVGLAGKPPASVTFELDAATAAHGVALVTSEYGVFYGADPNSPDAVSAHWTGAAGDGDPANGANWCATNLAERAIANPVLNSETDVFFHNDATVKVPATGFTLKQLKLDQGKVLTLDASEWSGHAGDTLITTVLGFTPASDIWSHIRVVNPRMDVALSADGLSLVAMAKSTIIWRHKKYGYDRAGIAADCSFREMPLADYTTYVSPTNAFSCLTTGGNTAWQTTYLKQSQNRLDGWFLVTSEQAGEWTLTQKFDDYEALAIDGEWKVLNPTYTRTDTVKLQMTEGWHHFTIIAGDTYGGYGASGVSSLAVTLPGAENAIAFDERNFTFDYPSANIAGDWTIAGTGVLPGVSLEVASNCRVVLDPAATQLKLLRAPSFENGAKLALASKYAAATSGIFVLMTWEQGTLYTYGVPVANLFDATSSNGAKPIVFVMDNADGSQSLVLTLDGNHEAVTAHWTGAVDNDVANAANWVGKNANGEDIQDCVPAWITDTFIDAGECNFNLPSGVNFPRKSLTLATPITLSADCDWRGLGGDVEWLKGVTIDVNGHALYLASGVNLTSGTVTSGVAGGTFHLEVPASKTVTNTGLALTGSLKLVKEGAGTYIAQCRNQSYTGGNDIVGGIATSPASPDNDIANWSPWNSFIYGARGSVFTVGSGAMFDMNGNYDYRGFGFVLAGGTLRASGRDMTKDTWGCAGGLTLTADSIFQIDATLMNNGDPVFNLNGHTLDVRLANGKYWKPNKSSFINGGKVKVTLDGVQATTGMLWNYGVITATDTDWDLNCRLEVKNNIAVHDFTCRREGGWGWSEMDKKVLVNGTFAPISDYFCNVELQNNATLDLSMKSAPWSLHSLDTANSRNFYATFVNGATINIAVGERTVGNGEKLIAWDAIPENVKFALSGTKRQVLVRRADGLYVYYGAMIYVR